MAEDYDLAYYFRVDGWIEYLPEFVWKDEEKYLLSVKPHPYFLSIPFNRDFAKEVAAMRGNDSLYAGLNEKCIAAEAFSHAFFYYATENIKDLHPKIQSTYDSSKTIDIASGDGRIGDFELIWDAVRFSPGNLFDREIFIY